MKLALLAGFLVLLGITGLLVSTIVKVHEHYHDTSLDYAVIMDAGSTSTKTYIYQWEHKTTSSLPDVSLSFTDDNVPRTYKVKPGIASITPNVSEISNYLDPILSWVDTVIPDDKKSSTPIYFQGTGGLRQLSEIEQGALLTSVRFKLQDAGYKFDTAQASIIDGAQEAGYGFLAVNGLYGYFDPSDQATTPVHGSLDMGGVSSDIAFISDMDHPPANYSFTTEINGTTYTIYAQSIDGLGINAARCTYNASLVSNATHNVIYDPCIPAGYWENVTFARNGALESFTLLGTSDFSGCQAGVRALVRSLTFNLAKPPALGSTLFIVADHYLDVKEFFKLKDNANLLELSAKTESFCGLNYNDAVSHHNKFDGEVQNYCFMGNFIVSLLRDYYGFDQLKRHILWKDDIYNTPISWSLGSAMYQVDQIEPDTSSQAKIRFTHFFRTAGGTVVLFISCLLIVLGTVLYILQRRRPVEYVPIR